MKKCLIVLVLLAWGAVLFSGGAKTVYDFERDTYYGFYWMLDSELHTWVGSSDYVDIRKDVFDYLFNNLIPRNEKTYRDLKNQLRNLENALSEGEKYIQELKGLIAAKEAEINDLKGKLDKRDAEIKTLKGQLYDKDEKIKRLEEQITTLRNQMSGKEAEIKTLKDDSSQLRSRFITAIVIGIVAVVVQFVVIFVLRRRKTESVT